MKPIKYIIKVIRPLDWDYLKYVDTLEEAISYAKHQRLNYYSVVFDVVGKILFEHGQKPHFKVSL